MTEDTAAALRRNLESEIARLSAATGLTGRDVPTFDNHDGARPFISVGVDGGYGFIALERGELCFEQWTRDADELLYWAFEHATANASRDWARQQGLIGDEFLSARWQRQASLLYAMRPEWARRWLAEVSAQPGQEERDLPAFPPPPLVVDPPDPLPVRPRRWWNVLGVR